MENYVTHPCCVVTGPQEISYITIIHRRHSTIAGLIVPFATSLDRHRPTYNMPYHHAPAKTPFSWP